MAEDFTEFATVCTPHLYRSALLLCGDHHGAWDLVQEALARTYVAWERKHTRIDHPAAYAHRTLINTYISKRRGKSSHELPTDTFEELQYRNPDIDLQLVLSDALGQLRRLDRTILVLRYFEDRSVTDTADILNLSPGAVRNRSMRALTKLRAILPLELQEQP